MKKIMAIMVFLWIVLSGFIVGQLFLSKIVSAPEPDLPDLKISPENITLSNTNPIAGEPVIINTTIWNMGNADAYNAKVNFYEENTLISSEFVDIPINKTWTNHTIDSEFEVGSPTSIAVDSLNGVHICYRDITNNALKYAFKPNEGIWDFSTIYSGSSVKSPSIAIDANDGVHISFRDNSASELKYAYKPNGGSWSFQTVISTNGAGMESSIAIDRANGVHISSYDNVINALKYAYKPYGGSWTNQTVDSNSTGRFSSVAIDDADGVHISYYDDNNNDLKYAYKPFGGSWTKYTLDSDGDVGTYSSIVLDEVNGVHISYCDSFNDYLKYAYKPSGGSWTLQTLDSTGLVGESSSITVDDNGGLHISYYDMGNKDLKYAYKPSGDNWSFQIIDSLGDVGRDTSIIVDGTGSIHISYHDQANRDLKYANLIAPPRNVHTSISWTPTTAGLRNITVKIDENNEIEELDDTNNEATITILINDTDSDYDALTNSYEYSIGTNPFKDDSDGDSLGDGFEVIFSKTNATLWDSNDNGIGDGLEFVANYGYAGGMQSLPNDWIGMTITWQNYTIYIKTNSSVLEGEFDKEEQKLKLKVSGPEGTQGVTELEIPKSQCDPEDIEILIDGELINYTLTEYETYYHIHIEYNHSVHDLSASYGSTIESPPNPTSKNEEPLTTIYIIFSITALIAVLLLLAVIIRNKGKSEDIGMHELTPEMISVLLDKRHDEGEISDETFKDAKSLLEKFRSN